MTISLRNLMGRRQHGAAAVELAIIVPILIVLMSVPLFFGRYFWHYTVAHKAANNSAQYLSRIAVREMKKPQLAAAAGGIARGIADEMLADLSPGGGAPTVEVFCGIPKSCIGYANGPMPETVAVIVTMNMVDNIFGVVNTGFFGWQISVKAEVRYVGR